MIGSHQEILEGCDLTPITFKIPTICHVENRLQGGPRDTVDPAQGSYGTPREK